MNPKDSNTKDSNTAVQAVAGPAPVAANAAPAPEAVIPAHKYVLQADNIDDLAVQFASILVKTGQSFKRTEPGPENKAKGVYSTWNLDDGMSVGFPGSEGLGLTAAQAKLLGTPDGCPHILAMRISLRQFVPFSSITAKLEERRAATATRDKKAVDRVSNQALLDELNARRIANGEEPIEL